MNRVNIRPLSVNEAYKGRRFDTDKKKAFVNSLLWMLPKKVDTFDKMQINIKLGFKSGASDIDNHIKAFLDCLQKKYKFNDNRVYRMVLDKEVVKEPFIEFEILEYKN